ncbi:MAG: N-acetylmuramoyl-L-alanine amidase family protein [Brevinematia bacterium]
MERKKLIFFLCLILFSSQSTNYQSLFEFSKKNSLIIKSNFDFGYIDLIQKEKNIRIFLTMPYILYKDKIKFMNENIIFKNGEIFIPLSYKIEIEQILNEKPQIVSTNIISSNVVSSQTKSSNVVSKPATNMANVKIKNTFKPMNCIIIDPGHGGKDPGGLGVGGLEEKKLVLEFSKILARNLEKQGIKVFLTRNADKYMSLKERIDFVKKIVDRGYNPVFISIHGNISLNPKVEGFEIYTLSDKASDEEAIAVEMKENINFDKEDIQNTEELYEILKDLISDGLKMQSDKLAESVIKNLSQNLITAKSHKKANFYVLKYNFVPSALLEIGYMSNIKEVKKFSDKNYLEKLASSIADGMKDFVYYYNKTGGFSR